MALSKKTLTWIFVLAIVAIVIAIVMYVFRCDIFKNLSSCVADPNETNTPVPPGSPTPKWIDESAPYNVGMFGPKIKALQTALGITADGKFGQQTRGAVIAAGKQVPLSESDYNAIVNPVATGGGANFQALKTGLGSAGKNFTGGLLAYMSGPNQVYRFNFYTNGRVWIYDPNNNVKAQGEYSQGGKLIIIDPSSPEFENGSVYTSNTVTLNMQKIANDLG